MNTPALKGVGRELLAVAAACAIGLVLLGLNWRTRAPSFTNGCVVNFELVEQKVYADANSILRAQVEMPGHSEVSIALPNGSTCHVGSQIQIEEEHTLFGSVFKAGLRGCSSEIRDTEPKAETP